MMSLLFLILLPVSNASDEHCVERKTRDLQKCQQANLADCKKRALAQFEKCKVYHHHEDHQKQHAAQKRDPVQHALMHHTARTFMKEIKLQKPTFNKHLSPKAQQHVKDMLQKKIIQPGQWTNLLSRSTTVNPDGSWQLVYSNPQVHITLKVLKGSNGHQITHISCCKKPTE